MLRWKFDGVKEKVKEVVDLLIKQQYTSLKDVTNITKEDLEGMKAADAAIETLNDYLEEHSKMMDKMAEQLDDIQKRLIKLEEKEKEA